MGLTNIKAPNMPSGIEDFAEMREWRVTYENTPFTIADKTRFLPDILSSHNKVIVFTRPIRFMKSSTLSMLSKFVSINDAENNKHLFEGLDIAREEYAEFRAKYQGQFPVIYLSFKGVTKNIKNWAEFKEVLAQIMSDLYRKHKEVLSSLEHYEQEQYLKIIKKQGSKIELSKSLADLATYMATHYKKKVIILIDEYDTPLHNAHKNTNENDRGHKDSYFSMASDFLSGFLEDALKGNDCLEKGFMTGVSHIAFSSLYSSLNNARAYSVFSPNFVELFGFTESEVESFISQVEGVEEEQRNNLRDVIKSWYNGYYIGNKPTRIYNPWSVAQFFNDLPNNTEISGQAYWLEVGDSFGLSDHLEPRFENLYSQFIELILGKSIQIEADKIMKLTDLDDVDNDSAFWGLLLHAGYLSASNIRQRDERTLSCDVSIPNHELISAYSYLIKIHQKKYDYKLRYNNAITNALVKGDIPEFSKNLKFLMETSVSFHDLLKNKQRHAFAPKYDTREQVYHAFILGLLAGMASDYEISSNGESGYGRYDIMLKPREKNGHGLILELKSTDSMKSLAAKAKEALGQIEAKRYAAKLEKSGLKTGIHIGMSFYGKHFHIEHKKVSYTAEEMLPLS